MLLGVLCAAAAAAAQPSDDNFSPGMSKAAMAQAIAAQRFLGAPFTLVQEATDTGVAYWRGEVGGDTIFSIGGLTCASHAANGVCQGVQFLFIGSNPAFSTQFAHDASDALDYGKLVYRPETKIGVMKVQQSVIGPSPELVQFAFVAFQVNLMDMTNLVSSTAKTISYTPDAEHSATAADPNAGLLDLTPIKAQWTPELKAQIDREIDAASLQN
jgi:hypothetical protein